MKNRKGFTIVELVIVIAVIGILAAVLIPTFTTVTKQARLSAATSQAKDATTAVNSAMSATLPKGSIFAISNDNDFDAEYWFTWNDALEQVDINKDPATGSYPPVQSKTVETVTTNTYTVYVTSDCFTNPDLTAAQITANKELVQKTLLSVATKGAYAQKTAAEVTFTEEPSTTKALIVWAVTYDEVNYKFNVFDNEDIKTTCVAFINYFE